MHLTLRFAAGISSYPLAFRSAVVSATLLSVLATPYNLHAGGATTRVMAKAMAPKRADVTTSAGCAGTGGIQLLLKKPKITGQLRGGKPVITGVSGEFSGGQVVMQGQINLARPQGTHFARIHLSDVQIAPVLALAGKKLADAGDARLSGILNVSWSGTSMDSIRQTLKGEVSLLMAEGTLTSADLMQHVTRITGIEQLQQLDFTKGTLEATVEDGKVDVLSHTMEGPAGHLQSKGHLDLMNGQLDLTLNLEVKEELALSSPRFGFAVLLLGTREVEVEGVRSRLRTVPPVRIAGAMPNPSVSLLTGKTLPAISSEAATPGTELPLHSKLANLPRSR